MKKLLVPFFCFIFVMNNFAYNYKTHQYAVHQAYLLLKNYIGNSNIPPMFDHLGDYERGTGLFNPGGLIIIGASREDDEDIVYKNYGLVSMYVTCTHFWNPDQGDDSHFCSQPDNTCFENAYQKAFKMVYGGYELQVPYTANGIIEAYQAPSNLFEFYRTGTIYYKGYYSMATAEFITRGYWHTASMEFRNRVFWEIIGRICHLLADVSVPAHSHSDQHDGTFSGKDSFEGYMENVNDEPLSHYPEWSYLDAITQGGIIDITNKSNPIKYLMYSTAQIANHFPSDDVAGDNTNGLGDSFTQYTELSAIISSLGVPPTTTPFNHHSTASTCYVFAIRSIASFLYWCARETNILYPVTYNISRTFEFDASENLPTLNTWNVAPISSLEEISKPSGTYSFTGWTDRVYSNPRTYSGSSNYTAIYKLHLKSNISTPTAIYGQNHLASYFFNTQNQFQCMTYESGGEIWAAQRSNSQDQLGIERRVSSGNGYNKNPSIAIYGSDYMIVWERWNNNAREIYFSKLQYGIWQTPILVTSYSITPPNNSPLRPISWIFSSSGLHRIHVYYQRSSTIYSRYSTDGGSTWIDGYSVSGYYPNLDGNYSILNITSEYQNALYLGTNYYPNSCTGCWNNYEQIAASYWIDYSGQGDLTGSFPCASQVRNSYDRTYVSWLQFICSDNDHYYYIVQSKGDVSGWSAATAYSVSDPYADLSGPTLAVDDHINYKSVMLWSENNQIKKVSGNTTTGIWNSTISNLNSGKYPAFEHSVPHFGSMPSYMYTSSSSPYYSLNSSYINTSLAKTTFDENENVFENMKYSRVIYAADTVNHQTISIKVSQPKINNKLVEFMEVNDTLPGINKVNFFEYLKTGNTLIQTDSDTLELSVTVFSKNFKDSTISFPILFNAFTNNTKLNEGFSIKHKLNGKYSSYKFREAIKNMKNQSFNINLSGILPKETIGKNWIFGIAHVYDQSSGETLAKEIVDEEISLPTKYGLSNYPNPFNPLTVIAFQLPKEGMVTIKIYDILGNEIETLINEKKTAGKHEVVFNGANLSSGMYICNMKSNSFNTSRKILLIK